MPEHSSCFEGQGRLGDVCKLLPCLAIPYPGDHVQATRESTMLLASRNRSAANATECHGCA